jgi:hypothetical protein
LGANFNEALLREAVEGSGIAVGYKVSQQLASVVHELDLVEHGAERSCTLSLPKPKQRKENNMLCL